MWKYLVTIIVVLVGVITLLWLYISNANDKWKIAEANVKAYSNALSITKNTNSALLLSVAQLNYFNDSIIQALDSTRKELKIKDKNLKVLQSIKSDFSKKDTIKIVQQDTLFKDASLSLDTLMGDKWYNLHLELIHPSTIIIEPLFKSEKHVIVSGRKETVNPPKKFFLARWFLKKHIVLQVDIVEKNPYVKDENSRYIEIIKK